MKVCIVGAGVAGLAAAKHCSDYGYECTVYEQTQLIGGTWNYTDEIGIDSNGIPVPSVMYRDLTTNLPKEIMQYTDFPYSQQIKESYLKQPEVLRYIHEYANEFQLKPLIKFCSQVINVKPIEGDRWRVTVKDLREHDEVIEEYDAIMICNGHFCVPFIPKVAGMDVFRGKILHSGHFRRKYPYVSKKVLVIGSGPSGCGIAEILAEVANKVVVSSKADKVKYPLNKEIPIKPIVKQFYEHGVVYSDDTTEEFDAVIFSTGYNYSFPFLSDECGIKVEDNYIRHLYKHIINVERPTMGFIGVNYLTIIFSMMDIQSTFFLESLKRNFLPTKDRMMEDVHREEELRRAKNWPTKHFHRLGDDLMYDYFKGLATVANIKPLPEVYFKIYYKCKSCCCFKNNYKIIDDENFLILNE